MNNDELVKQHLKHARTCMDRGDLIALATFLDLKEYFDNDIDKVNEFMSKIKESYMSNTSFTSKDPLMNFIINESYQMFSYYKEADMHTQALKSLIEENPKVLTK